MPGTTSPIININSYATNQALAVTGLNAFVFTPTNNLPTNQSTNTRVIIIGNETGGRAEIDITVTPKINE